MDNFSTYPQVIHKHEKFVTYPQVIHNLCTRTTELSTGYPQVIHRFKMLRKTEKGRVRTEKWKLETAASADLVSGIDPVIEEPFVALRYYPE